MVGVLVYGAGTIVDFVVIATLVVWFIQDVTQKKHSVLRFGAMCEPAVRALTRAAAEAGCWMDTGEGGLSPFHLEGGCDVMMQIGTANYGIRDGQGKFSDERAREIAAYPQVKAFE